MYEPKYNCNQCLDNTRRSDSDILVMQKAKGCFEPQKHIMAGLDSSGYDLYMCPGRMFGEFEVDLLKDFQRLRDYNVLRHPGSIGDQPAWWVDAMDFIKLECISWDNIKAEKEHKKQEMDRKWRTR